MEASDAAPRCSLVIVASRFNEQVVEGLMRGALGALREAGVTGEQLTLVRVPGALELPVTALHLARTGRYAAVIVLGAVIRGETDHYDYVCANAMGGCARVAEQTGVPVLVGLLTCATKQLALARSGEGRNKGAEVARAALDMVELLARLDRPDPRPDVRS